LTIYGGLLGSLSQLHSSWSAKVTTDDVIIHELYRASKNVYDIALVRLLLPIHFNAKTDSIQFSSSKLKLSKKSIVTVIGFGIDVPNQDLLYSNVDIEDDLKCEKAFHYNFDPETELCVNSTLDQVCMG
jgi:hypothetical protein